MHKNKKRDWAIKIQRIECDARGTRTLVSNNSSDGVLNSDARYVWKDTKEWQLTLSVIECEAWHFCARFRAHYYDIIYSIRHIFVRKRTLSILPICLPLECLNRSCRKLQLKESQPKQRPCPKIALNDRLWRMPNNGPVEPNKKCLHKKDTHVSLFSLIHRRRCEVFARVQKLNVSLGCGGTRRYINIQLFYLNAVNRSAKLTTRNCYT